MILRFSYERRYQKRGVLIDCRWFLLRFYPPVWPSWTFWPKVHLFRHIDVVRGELHCKCGETRKI